MAAFFYLLRSLVRPLGYDLKLVNMMRPNPVRAWAADAEFMAVYAQIAGRSAMNADKLYVLYGLAKNMPDGDVAEIGVYRGGSSFLLASTTSNQVRAFDTFEGMPETSDEDTHHRQGDFPVSFEEVSRFLSGKSNIRIHRGRFPDTAKGVRGRYGLVHIDVDIYQSVKDCLDYFYPRTLSGGFILADDYGAYTCPGAKKAWDEFFAGKPETTIYLPSGQALVIKV